MRTSFTVLLLFCFYFAFSFCQTSGGVIYQGFNYHWEREELGYFKTPHRLGSFESLIIDEQFTETSGQATANFTFTPGVNGDYSEPKIYTSSFINAPGVGVLRKNVDFSYSDNATLNEYGLPDAQYVHSEYVRFNVNTTKAFTVLLRGINIDMKCNLAMQPSGGECNSNGVWPYHLDVKVSDCVAESGNTSACLVTYQLFRSWVPFHFRFQKPFNYVMSYTVNIGLTIIYGDFNYQELEPVVHKTNVEYPASTITETVETDVLAGYQDSTVGMTGFSFTLLETLDLKAPGRYLEGLALNLQKVNYDSNNGNFKFNATMGYDTTYTNMPVRAIYGITPTVIQLPKNSFIDKTVSGTVCFNDEAFPYVFRCGLHKLPAQTHDSVSFKIP